MSELPAGFFDQSTEAVLLGMQRSLQPFAEHPERYSFEITHPDNRSLYSEGLGSIALNYQERTHARVNFRSEEGLAVSATYRLHTGVWVAPLPFRQTGALVVQFEDTGSVYYPHLWPDGGYSLQRRDGHNLGAETYAWIAQRLGDLRQFEPRTQVAEPSTG